MTREKRRKRLVGVAGGVLATVGAVLIALLISTLGGHAGADFRVRLETDRTQVVRLGKAGLAVYIEELDGTSAGATANGNGRSRCCGGCGSWEEVSPIRSRGYQAGP